MPVDVNDDLKTMRTQMEQRIVNDIVRVHVGAAQNWTHSRTFPHHILRRSLLPATVRFLPPLAHFLIALVPHSP